MSTTYISCACNSQPRAVDWGTNGLVCYGYSNSIAIYDPNVETTGKVLQTLHKHSSQVKVVQWIETDRTTPETEILSGSRDGSVIVWSKTPVTFTPNITITLGDQLTTAHAAYLNSNEEDRNEEKGENRPLLICASSFKEIFSVWLRTSSGTISDKQTLDLKGKIPTEARITHLPGPRNTPALIIVMDDATIHLFTWSRPPANSGPPKLNFQLSKQLTGHQDWIQCLDIMQISPTASLLASGSQDGTIRLWKISISSQEKPPEDRVNEFTVENQLFEVTLESILSGHEHWVYGVHWHPPVLMDGEWRRPNKLLSSALDKTMIIWEPNSAGVWMETVRLGKVGGNTLGFYGGKFNGDGTSVLAHGYQGTFHMWRFEEELKRWNPRTAPSGHFSDVSDLHWDPEGRYLITTSLDQTTRVHVPWRKSGNSEIWHEIGRPQIHGYDINCLAVLSPHLFASGAEEKVVRIFEAPLYFKKCLEGLEWRNPRSTGDRASVPALGLTNKAVDGEGIDDEVEGDDLRVERPPTEEEIVRYTLWPELEKLYGHGYEIFAMAARRDGRILATSCKSANAEHSSIILWSTKTWGQIQKLSAHRLTVTQMEFSPNDQFLISVSRDRRWALYRSLQDSNNDNINYEVILVSPAANALHTRIIWCCCWTPDSKYFATGSREGKIGLWNADSLSKGETPKPVGSLDLQGSSVTALAFHREILKGNNYVLAIGVEEGRIEVKRINFENNEGRFLDCLELDTSAAHHRTVKRLSFRPNNTEGVVQLASCSSDRAVKIYDIEISRILGEDI
ncbi:probable elongator complex protein 2 [Diachasma alloeum]|uniref:probable elongator complex protein 2 n=1 Tax=Diachasma alloeum TaxID=454923 RepID=UPI0007382FA0|nr:probable elongator complex protein 2 [Diachasma alloeum]